MEALIVVALVVGTAVLAGGLIYWSVQRERARQEAIEAKGWRYQKVKRGFEVEGISDAMVWSYRAVTSSGNNHSSSRRSGRWTTAAEPVDDIVLLGPPLPAAMLAMGFSGMLVQFLAKMVLGDRADDLARARELQLPPALQGKMSLVGTDQAVADAFLTDAVVEALAAMEPKPVVLRWKDSLEVRVHDRVADVETIERVAALGEVLAGSIGY